jgi:hypothetical protein
MCPLCISSMALTVAGATSTGAAGAFMVRRFSRIVRKPKTQQPDCKEKIRHDNEPAPEHSLAS